MPLNEKDLTKINDMIEPLKEKIAILNESNANLRIRIAALKKLISQDVESQMRDMEEHHEEQFINLLNEIDVWIWVFKSKGINHENISTFGIGIASLIMSKIAEIDETKKIDPNRIWGEDFMQRISNDITSFTDDDQRKKYIDSMVQELMTEAKTQEID